ncbi:MAG: phosphodiesterase, family [Candidatus Saccharibacteria bacterium]|jgi:putative phosphoesterase|nr:phosphodiesterase, family [Candidatus Saccharibacteria bacterium]MDB5180785.1 phosphodiesterase, family [Candidatus Saccharibacteria bacterium]MDB5180794.1 phosphodiesterase, family [Candidatus Saccharibacteria bacterium]
MILGIISDTHDRLPAIDIALAFFKKQKVEMVLHCGDWKSLQTVRYFAEQANILSLPVRGVLGNNDLDVADFIEYALKAPGHFMLQENALEFEAGNVTGVIYHGHHKPTLRKIINEAVYSIILLGHTHKPLIEKTEQTLIVNPGSTAFSIPRSKQWVPTVAIINTDTLDAKIHYLK